jgi:hypothetical protein
VLFVAGIPVARLVRRVRVRFSSRAVSRIRIMWLVLIATYTHVCVMCRVLQKARRALERFLRKLKLLDGHS